MQWAEASSGALESAPAVTRELCVCRAWMLRAGLLICLSRGRSVLAVLGSPGLCLSWGEARSWAVYPAPCAPGPALLELRSWPRSPLSAEPPEPPPRCSQVQPCACCSPWGARRTLPGAQVSVSVPGSLRASPPSWGPAPTPCEPFPPGKVGAASASPGRGSPVLGTLARASARLLVGPRPPGGLCFFISFFPSSYLDRSVTSSHCSIPAVLSLKLRPHS